MKSGVCGMKSQKLRLWEDMDSASHSLQAVMQEYGALTVFMPLQLMIQTQILIEEKSHN
jgi:hypothetical protein